MQIALTYSSMPPPRRPQTRGFGMGLAIRRSSVEALGGKLWTKNNPAHGATFYFTLPIAKGNSV
jgi:signal transduction histidine kinase